MMKELIYAIIIIIVSSVFPSGAVGIEAPKNMKEFNVICPAQELCPILDQSFESCNTTKKKQVCLVYVNILKELIPIYDCQFPVKQPPNVNYIVPGFWLCNSQKLWAYIELLSQLDLLEAQELFASPQFRSILSGELIEGFYDLSMKKQKEMEEISNSK